MITNVTLRNWRSHLESEFQFTSGTNGLVGILGSGKSSVLDAICFALFGTFPNLNSKKLKLDDIVMKKPIARDRAEVFVSFKSSGKNYSVKRVIEKGKGTTFSELRENEKTLESPSASRVTELVEKTLKISYDLFSKAIYSEQNALDYFLTIPKGQRMKKIDELLMIDKFEKARSNTVSLVNKIAERKLAKQSVIDQTDVDGLHRNIIEMKSASEKAWSEKLQFEKDLNQTMLSRQAVEKELADVRKLQERLELARRDEKVLSSLIEENYLVLSKLETSVKNMDREAVSENLRELSKVSRELESLLGQRQQDYEKTNSQFLKSRVEAQMIKKERLDILESEIQEKIKIQKDLASHKKLLSKDLEKELDGKKLAIEKLVGEIEVIKIKIRDLEEVIEQLSSAEGKCPICATKLTEEKKIVLIKQRAFQIDSLREKLEGAVKKKTLNEKEARELESIASKLDEMLDAIRDLDKVKADYENAKNIFDILSESAVKLEAETASLRLEISNMQKKLSETLESKQRLEITFMQFRDYEERKLRMESFMKKREEAIAHLSELEKGLAVSGPADLEINLRSLIEREKDLSVKVGSISQFIKERESHLHDLEKNLQNILREKEEVLKLDATIKQLKIFEKSLEQTQNELRKEFITSVNYTMNNLWPDLYPYRDFVGVRIAVEENDYILQLQERSGSWVNVEGFASGGERSIAALTLRIAFALVLAPQLRWLVLDEPTHNLDQKAVEDLAATLSERIGSIVDQVFIITHDEKLANAITGSLYKLDRDKAKDGMTKAVMVS